MTDLGRRRVVCAIIQQAVQDATCRGLNTRVGITDNQVATDPSHTQDALRFLESRDFEVWCESVGIDADAIRERVLQKVAA